MIRAENLSKVFVKSLIEDDKQKKTKFSLLGKGKEVKKEFYAVNHLNFEIKKGEIVGILGPNGAGKTTLLRMLGKLMEPTEGCVVIEDEEGNPITDTVLMKKQIGYLSGNTKLYRRFSTREMLQMLGEIYGLSSEECEKRINEIFQVLDMEGFGDNQIDKLSTGQMQRASIARCLIHDPEIYIFDEPTLGLDIISADAIVQFMKGQKKLGKTVLYSTHYLEEAQYMCDRILMIYSGEIVEQGSPEEIMERHAVTNLRDAFHKIMEGKA